MFEIGLCISSCGLCCTQKTLCPRCVLSTLKANGISEIYENRIKDIPHREYDGNYLYDELRKILKHLDCIWNLSGKALV